MAIICLQECLQECLQDLLTISQNIVLTGVRKWSGQWQRLGFSSAEASSSFLRLVDGPVEDVTGDWIGAHHTCSLAD